jgi:hypothetical protein
VRVLDQCLFDAEGIKAEESGAVVCQKWKYKIGQAAALIYKGSAAFDDAPYASLFETLASSAPLLTFSVETIAHDVGPTYRAKFSRRLMTMYQESRMVREWLPEKAPDATEQLVGLVLRPLEDTAWQELLAAHADTIRTIVAQADWSRCDAIQAENPPANQSILARLASLRAIKEECVSVSGGSSGLLLLKA